MTYDFDQIIDRRKDFACKWSCEKNELPLSIADMDFKTSPAVTEALSKKALAGAYGYTDIDPDFYLSIIDWWKNNHQYEIKKNEMIFTTGIVPAISSLVNRLSNIGDNVVLLTPVYNIFFNSIINHGRHALEEKLIYQDGKYYLNYQSLEEKLANPVTSLMILCNPHNPIGKIWTKEELARINDLCVKNGVTIISDEIHCDLTDPGYSYVPFGSVNEACKMNSVICLSASKAFNLAGLQGACIVVSNPFLFNKAYRALNSYEVAEPNFFTVAATIAAFREGHSWLTELRKYVFLNKEYVKKRLSKELKDVFVVADHATYLLWLDCSKVTDNTDLLADFIKAKTGLILSKGSSYHGNGNLFLRMNIACPRQIIVDATNRLVEGIKLFMKEQKNG